jgi:hypothetical protein
MLDCHIIVRHETKPEWLAQCRSSVHAAAERAGFPVEVFVVEAVTGHIGNARASGYALGTNPYVTYVDDDDYVTPDAFASMSLAIHQFPDAIFMAESQLQNGQMRAGPQRHHLCVYRRDQLIDHTQWVVCGDLAQMNAVAGKHCVDIPDKVYVHRLYQSGGRALRRHHHDELRIARA